MNGRVYEPLIGRFVSADPYVPDALDTQSFNRYSYVNNNPLSYIDPSGFSPAGGPDGCDPRDIDCGPRPVIPCDFSPHCGSSPWSLPPSPWFTPRTYGFIVRSHVRMPVHWPRMPTVPRADFPMGNGSLAQQETVFDGAGIGQLTSNDGQRELYAQVAVPASTPLMMSRVPGALRPVVERTTVKQAVRRAVHKSANKEKPKTPDQVLKETRDFYNNLKNETRQPEPLRSTQRPTLQRAEDTGLGLMQRALKGLQNLKEFFDDIGAMAVGNPQPAPAPSSVPPVEVLCPSPDQCMA